MKAYSLDLRERVVSAYQTGIDSIREVSEHFQVSPSFLKKMLARHRADGSLSRAVTAVERRKHFPRLIADG